MRNNKKGMTLVEVLVALGIISLVGYGVSTLTVNVFKQNKKIEERGTLQRVIRSVVFEVSSKYKNYPGIIPDARFDDPKFDAYSDASISDRQCYTKEGEQTDEGSTTCFYKVAYYRLAILDTKFARTSDLSKIPLVRLFIKIDYELEKKPRSFVVSQFMTPYLTQ